MYLPDKMDSRCGTGERGSKKPNVGGVWQVPDDLHSSVPRSVQFKVLLRVQLPQSRTIESCGVDTKEVDHHSWLIVTKLLQNLVHFVIEYCSLAQDVCLGLRREGRKVQFG